MAATIWHPMKLQLINLWLPLALVIANGCGSNSQTSTSETITPIEWKQLEFAVEDRSQIALADLPQRIHNLDGKRVRVRGYVHRASVGSARGLTEFVLLGEISGEPLAAKLTQGDHYAIPLHHLMIVQMVDGQTAQFTTKPIAVTGRFSIKVRDFEGQPICVYRIVAESVERVPPREGHHCAVGEGC